MYIYCILLENGICLIGFGASQSEKIAAYLSACIPSEHQ